MSDQTQELQRVADGLYERHGRPLESQHAGEYMAISRDGRTVLGRDLRDVLNRAKADLGRGSFVFKLGDKAVWNWR